MNLYSDSCGLGACFKKIDMHVHRSKSRQRRSVWGKKIMDYIAEDIIRDLVKTYKIIV